MISDKMFNKIIYLISGILLMGAILAWWGIFTPSLSIPAQQLFQFSDGSLCLIKLDFTSKGTFVVNQNIKVNAILFKTKSQLDNMGIKKITILFTNSFDFSKQRDDDLVDSGIIELKYNHKTNLVEGELNSLKYLIPGQYGYALAIYTIDNNVPTQWIQSNGPKISIAPVEELLTIKNNNLMIALTLIMLLLAIISLKKDKLERKSKK